MNRVEKGVWNYIKKCPLNIYFLNASCLIDEMGNKIDDLEKNITELMAQAPEEPEK